MTYKEKALRDRKIFLAKTGLNGSEKQTLAEIALKENLNWSSVSRIVNSFGRKVATLAQFSKEAAMNKYKFNSTQIDWIINAFTKVSEGEKNES